MVAGDGRLENKPNGKPADMAGLKRWLTVGLADTKWRALARGMSVAIWQSTRAICMEVESRLLEALFGATHALLAEVDSACGGLR